MTRTTYDLTYGELSMSPLNTNANASTTGSGLYVNLWQTSKDTAAGEENTSHVLLFPEQIQPLIDFLIEQQKAARKADYSRDNAYRKLVEVHGFDSHTAHIILIDVDDEGTTEFVSEKIFMDAANTTRMRYTIECEWSGELQQDEYIIRPYSES